MLQTKDANPEFCVIGGRAVADILDSALPESIAVVKQAYLDHEAGRTNNPDSYFLRFPSQPRNRIIALPATLGGLDGLSGIKWISSFPGNLDHGMQRASAVLVLNNPETGYPFALLEASRISAVRTAASAVLGAYWLNRQSREAARISFVGGGIISRTILDMFVADGWQADRLGLCDLDAATTETFIRRAEQQHGAAVVEEDLETALGADVVVLATTSARPYITGHPFRPGQVVLHVSLRDIAPEIIAASDNVLDDVEHCLKADTSPDLAVRQFERRDFITGTLAQLIEGRIALDPTKPAIFSPFGLGVLDLAIGRHVHDEARRRGSAQVIKDFLFEMGR